MNPLFISHLVADFLLQPTWLVGLKEKHAGGTILHSLIHAAILGILIIPQTFFTIATILVIALTHGIIDRIKIGLPKKSFELAFALDQVAHAAILILAIKWLPFNRIFWNSESGILLLSLLIFFSFGVGLWNLMHIKNYPVYNFSQKATRTFTVLIVFLSFFTLTILDQF